MAPAALSATVLRVSAGVRTAVAAPAGVLRFGKTACLHSGHSEGQAVLRSNALLLRPVGQRRRSALRSSVDDSKATDDKVSRAEHSMRCVLRAEILGDTLSFPRHAGANQAIRSPACVSAGGVRVLEERRAADRRRRHPPRLRPQVRPRVPRRRPLASRQRGPALHRARDDGRVDLLLHDPCGQQGHDLRHAAQELREASHGETAGEPVGGGAAGAAGAGGGGEGTPAADEEGSGYHHQQEDGGSNHCQLIARTPR